MLRKSAALALCLGLLSPFAAIAEHAKDSNDPVFQQLDGIVKSLSEISGLEQKHHVPYGRMSKRCSLV
jgi:hypothetical protein